ncbi:hypothetical protein U9M48_012156 [Paspalum notatum var. saurae]|uniref:Bifunctional inhibitor/plant lipid transfer protein/seed storage helical domain-containing protein n=1 Tax=Paspalum notatum var. saurae TaxID=547442 RepID=A0AAQ3SWX2_PASNO
MAPSKLAMVLAVLSFAAAVVHSCEPNCPTPNPPPAPSPPVVPTPSDSGSCPIDALKLEVCANVLNLLKLNIPVSVNDECCPLLEGLTDLDAAICLCTAIKANVLGINIKVPIDLSILLNHCGKTCPPDFTCPSN